MTIPTEPIGNIPGPARSIEAVVGVGDHADPALDARQRAEQEALESKRALERKTEELTEANRRSREREALYSTALAAGRMGTWETDLVARTRLWTKEGMDLFGLNLADGRGHVGGEDDEYRSALHPDDRHLVQKFHDLANKQDSFTSEYRVVRPDGTTLWLRGRGQVTARTPDGKAERMVSIVTDVTERKAAEDHIQFLMHEISHRSKNLLMVIQSIARRTARTAGTMEEFENRFERRLQGLAASHDVLVRENWHGAPLADLVRQQLVPFVGIQSSRFEIAGPDIVITAEAAQAIGLAIHELATNAIKYGALSESGGKVSVSWTFDGKSGAAEPLLLNWIERDGPPVAPPSRKGFGHVVIGEMVERSLGGKVAMEFASEGLKWRVSIPATNLVSEPPPER
jgi:PAS domain S-box-containing protein